MRIGRASARPQPASPGSIDAARLRQLLQLTHPDKHANSELSHTVTAWLLEMRKAQRN